MNFGGTSIEVEHSLKMSGFFFHSNFYVKSILVILKFKKTAILAAIFDHLKSSKCNITIHVKSVTGKLQNFHTV